MFSVDINHEGLRLKHSSQVTGMTSLQSLFDSQPHIKATMSILRPFPDPSSIPFLNRR